MKKFAKILTHPLIRRPPKGKITIFYEFKVVYSWVKISKMSFPSVAGGSLLQNCGFGSIFSFQWKRKFLNFAIMIVKIFEEKNFPKFYYILILAFLPCGSLQIKNCFLLLKFDSCTFENLSIKTILSLAVKVVPKSRVKSIS